MLVYLDAGKNIKGAPNENFAREILELLPLAMVTTQSKILERCSRIYRMEST